MVDADLMLKLDVSLFIHCPAKCLCVNVLKVEVKILFMLPEWTNEFCAILFYSIWH